MLIAAVGVEQPKRCVIPHTVIHGKVGPDAPGILRIKSQPPYALRKAAIAAEFGLVCRIAQVRSQRPGVGNIEAWILWESEERFWVIGEPAAQHRFMNKINSIPRRVRSL